MSTTPEVENGPVAGRVPARRPGRVFLIAFLLVLAGVSLWLHAARDRRQGRVLAAQRQLASRRDMALVERTKALRSRFHLGRYYLEYARKNSYATADFIRRLYGIFPPQLRARSMTVDAGWQSLSFSLVAEVAAAERRQAKLPFSTFFQRLSEFPDVSQPAFSEDPPPSRRRAAAAGPGFVFQVTGLLEME